MYALGKSSLPDDKEATSVLRAQGVVEGRRPGEEQTPDKHRGPRIRPDSLSGLVRKSLERFNWDGLSPWERRAQHPPSEAEGHIKSERRLCSLQLHPLCVKEQMASAQDS